MKTQFFSVDRTLVHRGSDYKEFTYPSGSRQTVDDEFLEFHAFFPEVYQTLVKLTREAKKRFNGSISVRMIWEVARWELMMAGKLVKLNDHFHSRYARMIMASEPDLKDVFKTRKLKT